MVTFGGATSKAPGGATSEEISARDPSSAQPFHSGGCRVGGDPLPADLERGRGGASAHRRWAVSYEDTASIKRLQRFGSIVFHAVSRWITVRDDDNDILAGRYLQHFESPKAGDCLEIDSFQVVVGNLYDSRQEDLEKDKVCIDLSSPLPRFGGRFWVLADQEEEDDGADDGGGDDQLVKGDVADGDAGEATMSADVEDRLGVTVIRRRTQPDMRLSKKAARTLSMLRPWIGPLPKVSLPPATLSDFLLPNWQTVKKKHRKIRMFGRPTIRHDLDRLRLASAVPRATTPAMAPRPLREFRADFLHAALSAAGPVMTPSLMGYAQPGYKAQTGVLVPDDRHTSRPRVPCPAVPLSIARVPRAGFPRLGPGRAPLIPPARCVAAMSGRGASQAKPLSRLAGATGAQGKNQGIGKGSGQGPRQHAAVAAKPAVPPAAAAVLSS
ncbi:hypothetical protein ZWY2020_042228 [Hordeum vulgare]|nr:hypothetical protein ZWY2020_042228 [Hordeum vulgare]